MEEPVLTRLNRLHHILNQLEEIHYSPKSSYASTTSSGTLTSDGHPSFADWSPDRLEKRRCRPLNEVMMEVEEKGTLMDRLLHAEDRILKMCLQLEEELEIEKSREETKSAVKKSPKKSLKQFVQSCTKVKPKHKTNA